MVMLSKRLIEIYGSTEAAREAVKFFHAGPGVRLRAYFRDIERRLADIRMGQNNRKPLSLQDRALVVHARELSLENLSTVLAIMEEREFQDDEGAVDDEGEDVAPEPE